MSWQTVPQPRTCSSKASVSVAAACSSDEVSRSDAIFHLLLPNESINCMHTIFGHREIFCRKFTAVWKLQLFALLTFITHDAADRSRA